MNKQFVINGPGRSIDGGRLSGIGKSTDDWGFLDLQLTVGVGRLRVGNGRAMEGLLRNGDWGWVFMVLGMFLIGSACFWIWVHTFVCQTNWGKSFSKGLSEKWSKL